MVKIDFANCLDYFKLIIFILINNLTDKIGTLHCVVYYVFQSKRKVTCLDLMGGSQIINTHRSRKMLRITVSQKNYKLRGGY